MADNDKEQEELRQILSVNNIETDRHIKRIADGLLRGDNSVQFLFGAGMSSESFLPTSRDISVRLLKEYFPDDFNKLTAERVNELIYEFPFESYVAGVEGTLEHRRKSLTQHLDKLINDPSKKVHQGHKDLVSICDFTKPPLLSRIYTTNFDQLLEDAFGDSRAKKVTAKNPTDIRAQEKVGKIPVIHLHGTLDEEYQITETDLWSDKFKELNDQFESNLLMDVFVFVGYSMNDPDFRDIYMRYNDKMKSRDYNQGKWTYIVSPPKDKYSYLLGKEVWLTRQAFLIPLKASEFFARLKSRMELNVQDEITTAVKKFYDIENNEEKFNLLVSQTAQSLKCDIRVALLYLYRQSLLIEGN